MAKYDDKKAILEEVNHKRQERASKQRNSNVEYLVNDVGLPEEVAKKLVDKENLAPLGKEELTARVEFFKEKGLTNTEIGKISKKFPKIFSYTVPHMQEICSILQKSVGIDEKGIFETITSFPRIFSYKLENIEEKKVFIEKNLCPKGVSGIDMLNKDVRILCKSEKELGARKEFLKETFGLNEDECREVIFNNPYIVNMAKEGLAKKADAIEQVFGSKKYVLNDNFVLTAPPEKLKFNYMLLAQCSDGPFTFMKRKFYMHRPSVLYARAKGLQRENRKMRPSLMLQASGYFEKETGLNTQSLMKDFPFDNDVAQEIILNYHEKFPKVPITLDEEEIKVIVAGGHSARAKKEVEMGEV